MATSLRMPFSASPYPGLRPFQNNEADIFFGREEQTDQLLKKLQKYRFIAVVGQSGCGKSSLVRAGMMSALESGFLTEAGARWRIADMRPGGEPFARLAVALLSESALGREHEIEPDDLAFALATLRRGPLGITEMLSEKPLPHGANLLLLVDQFEEIFRFRREGDADEADAFVALLLATAAQQEFPAYIVITMRSDFIGDCAVFSGLPEAINDTQFLAPRLTREQSEAAIVKPARVFGGKVDPLLVNRLLNDMGPDPDQLPVLQHALMCMWRRIGEHPRESNNDGDGAGSNTATIALDDYISVGTLTDALSKHADEVYANLDDKQRHIAEVLFRRLTERGVGQRDTRRPARLGDVADVAGVKPEEVIAVVEEFRKPDRSFVTPPVGVPLGRETMLDIGHESLIRQWKKLNEWANEEANSAAIYQRMKQTAILWDKGEADLWGGIDLERACKWKEQQKPSVEWASRYGSVEEFALAAKFLEASRSLREQQEQREKEEEERRLRDKLERLQKASEAKKFKLLATALGFVVLLLAGAVAWAFNRSEEAVKQQEEAARQQKNAEAYSIEARRQSEIADKAIEDARKAVEETERQKDLASDYESQVERQKEEVKRQKEEAERQIARAVEAKRRLASAVVDAEAAERQKKGAELRLAIAQQAETDAKRAAKEAQEQMKAALNKKDEAEKDKAAAEVAVKEAQKKIDSADAYAQQIRRTALEELEKLKEDYERIRIEKDKQEALANLLKLNINTQSRPASPVGRLSLKVLDVYEKPVEKRINVVLRSQTASSSFKTISEENVDASKPIFNNLELPFGVYQIDVSSSSYLSVSKFVSIRASRPQEISLTLPLNPDGVDEVDFPEYEDLPEQARQLLEASASVSGFEGRSGDELYVALDKIRRAGLLNVIAKSETTKFENRRSVLSYIQRLTQVRGDRLFAEVSKELLDLAGKNEGQSLFQPVSAALYVPPLGYVSAGSFKTRDRFANLQLTFFTKGDQIIADIEIDDVGGLAGMFQAQKSRKTGEYTHPYEIQQILISQKINPLYRLKP